MSHKRHEVWTAGKIAYYDTRPDADHWDNHWEPMITRDYYGKFEEGDLGQYSFLEQYLQKNDFILEAGCGTAQYVIALRARGFINAEGIDWGEQTITSVKKLYPDLPVRVGDVTKIDVDNNYYHGYISLGVVEHRKEGPEPYLSEAFRVLRPGGYAFISVPYINSLRSLKRKLGFYSKANNANMTFYQYAYSKSEFWSFLEKAGFVVVATHGIAGSFGIRDEFLDVFQFLDRLPGSWRINRALKKFDGYDNLGHMIVFVCKKVVR